MSNSVLSARLSLQLAALCVGALAFPGAAMAESLAGRWSFSTGPYAGGACAMAGEIVFTPNKDGGHDCKFTAVETCPKFSTKAVETCQANVVGSQVTILSSVVTLDQKPHPYAFSRDNFALAIGTDGKMTGSLVGSGAWAKFERKETPVS